MSRSEMTKSQVWGFSLLAILLFSLIVTALVAVFAFRDSNGRPFAPGYDFNLRMNEISCLCSGVDPYAVWHRDVVKPPYYPLNEPQMANETFCEPINAYTPWGYVFLLPLAFLPKSLAWLVYFISMFVCLGVVFVVARKRVDVEFNQSNNGLMVAAASLLILAYPIFSNVCIGNLTIHTLLALMIMFWALNRKLDALAGCCWAFAMIKPQTALLLAVPLLFRGRWVPCVVAGGVCIVMGWISSLMCGVPLLTMIRETPAASTHAFFGCGTWPYFLCGYLPCNADILIGLAIGGLLCVFLTWCLRKESDWFVFAMPAVVCSTCWTYANQYIHLLSWFLVVLVLVEIVKNPKSRFLWILFVAIALSESRLYRCSVGLSHFFQIGTTGIMSSDYAFRCLDSLNSTLSLVVATAFCVWKRSHASQRVG